MDPEKMSSTGMTLDGRKHTVSLEHQVRFAGWTSPQAHDAQGYGSAERLQRHGTKHGCRNLQDEVHLAGWPTPMAGTEATEDYNEAGNTDSGRKTAELVSGTPSTSSTAPTTKRGALNPAHSRWLMGYPPAWDACGVTAMPSSRRSPQSLSALTWTHALWPKPGGCPAPEGKP